MGSDDPYELQAKVEHWQALASRQQDLGAQLRHLASEQREIAMTLAAAEAEDLTAEARRIEDGMRALSAQVLGLERATLDRMSRAIAEEARALRPE